MNRSPEAASASMLSRAPAMAQMAAVSDDDMDLIRELGDGSAKPEDVFKFRMVASGDGLDFYFTRQHESSMRGFVDDLKKGQAVLGSHDVNTFSYGSSFNAAIVEADPLAREYEAAFYRQYADRSDLATKHYVVGDYFLVRGVELNGQKTDDLIKSMSMGGIRKASISFTVGRYVCGLDDKDMVSSFFGPWPDEDEGCTHFPGVEYKKEGVGWAWMADNDLMETSLVYKNASPSAMLLRKAEALAQQGRIPKKELVKVEERLEVRLPAHDRKLFPIGTKEAARMTDTTKDPVEDPTTPPAEPPAEELPEGQAESVDDAEETPPETTEPVTPPVEESPTNRAAGVATRDKAIEGILGGPITVEAIRSLKRDADVGLTLFTAAVERAVTARVAAQGTDAFDSAKYRSFLLATKDADYVESEIKVYEEGKRKAFGAGRDVDPLDPEVPAEPTSDKGGGLLSSRKTAPKG